MDSARVLVCLFVVFIGATLFVWSCSRISPSSVYPINPLVGSPSNSPFSLRDALIATIEDNDEDKKQEQTQNQEIKQKPACKLLCLVLTQNTAQNRIKSRAVRETWGRRCDRLIEVYNGSKLALIDDDDNQYEGRNARVGRLMVPIGLESRGQLWHKIIGAFTYVRAHYANECEWFMKADDDTYVIVESLNQFLAQHSPEQPVYFGHRFKPFVKQGYMSGGSGYVLSRRALNLLVDIGFGHNLSQCQLERGTIEDVEMGACLEAVRVSAGDTRDSLGRPRFLPLAPDYLLGIDQRTSKISAASKSGNWIESYEFYGPFRGGKQCCSKEAISFHYIEPNTMRLIDWLLYDFKKVSH